MLRVIFCKMLIYFDIERIDTQRCALDAHGVDVWPGWIMDYGPSLATVKRIHPEIEATREPPSPPAPRPITGRPAYVAASIKEHVVLRSEHACTRRS